MTQMPNQPITPDGFVGEDMQVAHHKSVRARGLRESNMNLNLTSMIDVIFLLLIYFVITANFAVGEGVIMAKLPTGSGPAPKDEFALPKQKLKVRLYSVGGDGTQYDIEVVGSTKPQDFKDLHNILATMRFSEANPLGTFKTDDPVLIMPMGDVRWQHVVQAFNAALGAKFSDVRFSEARE